MVAQGDGPGHDGPHPVAFTREPLPRVGADGRRCRTVRIAQGSHPAPDSAAPARDGAGRPALRQVL